MNAKSLFAPTSFSTDGHHLQDCAHWIEKIVERRSPGVYTDSHGRTVMFDLLLEDNLKKGHHRLKLEELIDEALIFLTAGTDTTSYGLSAATFYVLNTPAVLQKLQEELYSVPRGEGGRIEWRSVQNLPYMVCHQFKFPPQGADLRFQDRYLKRVAPARNPRYRSSSPRRSSCWCSCARPIHSRRCKPF